MNLAMIEVKKFSVLIADDHAALRLGLGAIVNSLPGGELIGEAIDGDDAVNQYQRLKPDVMTLDLRMPGLDGLLVLERVLAWDPKARILVVSMYDSEDDVARSMLSGAMGFVLKSAPSLEIARAIETVACGKRFLPASVADQLVLHLTAPQLTAREREVLNHICGGASNKQIGKSLNLTEGTVKSHVRMIMGKLGAASRTEAVSLARERGLLK